MVCELHNYFKLEIVLSSLVISFLAFTFLSCIQFSLTLTSTRKLEGKRKRIYDYFLANEAWGVLVTLLIQDFPFFVIRLYVVINHSDLTQNYTIYFFLLKSLVFISLEVYRIFSLVKEEIQVSNIIEANPELKEDTED